MIGLVEEKHGKKKVSVSFECETLKADQAAEDHIRQFMPKLAGLDAVSTYINQHSPSCWPSHLHYGFLLLFDQQHSLSD